MEKTMKTFTTFLLACAIVFGSFVSTADAGWRTWRRDRIRNFNAFVAREVANKVQRVRDANRRAIEAARIRRELLQEENQRIEALRRQRALEQRIRNEKERQALRDNTTVEFRFFRDRFNQLREVRQVVTYVNGQRVVLSSQVVR